MNSAFEALNQETQNLQKRLDAITKKNEEGAKLAAKKDLDTAIEKAVGDFQFANAGAREATFMLLHQEAANLKRQPDGGYVAVKENLPLYNYLKNLEWLPCMLAPVGETAAANSQPQRVILGADGPVREAAGGFDVDAIRPGMSTAARDQARAVIASEIAKLQG